jgi:hypothetical protein
LKYEFNYFFVVFANSKKYFIELMYASRKLMTNNVNNCHHSISVKNKKDISLIIKISIRKLYETMCLIISIVTHVYCYVYTNRRGRVGTLGG